MYSHVTCKPRVLFMPSQSVHVLFAFVVLLPSSMMLNRGGKRAQSYLVLNLKGKAQNFSPINTLAVRLFIDVHYQVEEFPLFLSLLRALIMNRELIFQMIFLQLRSYHLSFLSS